MFWPVLLLGCTPVSTTDSESGSAAETEEAEAPFGGIDCSAEALEPRGVLEVDEAVLDEVSGLVISETDPSVWWVHNDSGDEARLYAVAAREGMLLATVSLDGVEARDFEDLAGGPCDAGSCLWVGDIGDNDAVRDSVVVHRLAEPAAADGSVTVDSTSLTWKDGAVDSEALWFDSTDETLWLATKELGETRLSQVVDGVITPMVTLPIDDGLVTGAEFRPGVLVLRTYISVLVFQGPRTAGTLELASQAPVRLAVQEEPQGEAVGLHPRGLVTASEGTPAVFHPWECPVR